MFGHHLRLCYPDATVNLNLDNNPDLAQYYRNRVSTAALDELIDMVLDAGLDAPLPP